MKFALFIDCFLCVHVQQSSPHVQQHSAPQIIFFPVTKKMQSARKKKKIEAPAGPQKKLRLRLDHKKNLRLRLNRKKQFAEGVSNICPSLDSSLIPAQARQLLPPSPHFRVAAPVGFNLITRVTSPFVFLPFPIQRVVAWDSPAVSLSFGIMSSKHARP